MLAPQPYNHPNLCVHRDSSLKSPNSALKYKACVSQFTVPIYFSQLPTHDRTVAMIISRSPWMIIAPVVRCGFVYTSCVIVHLSSWV